MAMLRKARRQLWHQMPMPPTPQTAIVIEGKLRRRAYSHRPVKQMYRYGKAKRTRPISQGAVTTTGYFPVTAADNAVGGTTTWTNPNNATLVDDNILATNAASGNAVLHAIDLTNINWGADATNIANASQILGITVQPKWSYTAGGSVNATTIQLLLSGVTIGSNKGSGATAWGPNNATTSYATTFGSASDMWGTTLTGSLLTSSSFGVRLQGTETDGGGGAQAIGRVGKGFGNDANTVTANFVGGNSGAGSTVLAYLASGQSSTLTPTTPTNFTLITSLVDANGSGYYYKWENASSIAGVTINYSTGGAVPVVLDIIELTGTGAEDAHSTVNSSTGSPTLTTGALTTTNANDILVAMFQGGSATITPRTLDTPGAGYTQVQSNNAQTDGSSSITSFETFKTVSATQSAVTTTCSAHINTAGHGFLVGFKAAVSGATAQLDAVKFTVTYIPGSPGTALVPTARHRFMRSPRVKITGRYTRTKRRIAPYIVGSVAPPFPVIIDRRRHKAQPTSRAIIATRRPKSSRKRVKPSTVEANIVKTVSHRTVHGPRIAMLNGKWTHTKRWRPISPNQIPVPPGRSYLRHRQLRATWLRKLTERHSGRGFHKIQAIQPATPPSDETMLYGGFGGMEN